MNLHDADMLKLKQVGFLPKTLMLQLKGAQLRGLHLSSRLQGVARVVS
jgi:hypothetical protein